MKFLFGALTVLILIPVCMYCYFRFGYAPVTTASAAWPFEKRLAHMALNARIEKEAPKSAPFQPAESDFQEGAHLYRSHCAPCHGLPDQAKTATAAGMYPAPPQLFHGKGVTDDPAGETYWKIANGIRLTGMPAYSNALSERQMWQMSLLLAGADKLPPPVRGSSKTNAGKLASEASVDTSGRRQPVLRSLEIG
jgi:thiosulfate dehydrogenase